jgi:phage FluMu protein Com
VAILIKCPGCGVAMSAAEKFAGKKIKCPKCGEIVLIELPAPVDEPVEEPAAQESIEEPVEESLETEEPAIDPAAEAEPEPLDFDLDEPEQKAVELSLPVEKEEADDLDLNFGDFEPAEETDALKEPSDEPLQEQCEAELDDLGLDFAESEEPAVIDEPVVEQPIVEEPADELELELDELGLDSEESTQEESLEPLGEDGDELGFDLENLEEPAPIDEPEAEEKLPAFEEDIAEQLAVADSPAAEEDTEEPTEELDFSEFFDEESLEKLADKPTEQTKFEEAEEEEIGIVESDDTETLLGFDLDDDDSDLEIAEEESDDNTTSSREDEIAFFEEDQEKEPLEELVNELDGDILLEEEPVEDPTIEENDLGLDLDDFEELPVDETIADEDENLIGFAESETSPLAEKAQGPASEHRVEPLPDTNEMFDLADPSAEPKPVEQLAAPVAATTGLTPGAIESLGKSCAWARFLGIMLFLGSLSIAAVGGYLLWVAIGSMSIGQLAVGAAMLFGPMLYLVSGKHLLTYSRRMKQFLEDRQSDSLEEAFKSQLAFWKLTGAVTALVILFYFCLLMAVLGLFFSGMITP